MLRLLIAKVLTLRQLLTAAVALHPVVDGGTGTDDATDIVGTVVDEVDDAHHIGDGELAVFVHIGSLAAEHIRRLVVEVVRRGNDIGDGHLTVQVGIALHHVGTRRQRQRKQQKQDDADKQKPEKILVTVHIL